MTDYPPPPVAGYKPLSQDQVDLINRFKALETEVAAVLSDHFQSTGGDEAERWIEIARTHLEAGFMFACKAVAQPSGGLGDAQ